jgi:hypothetical protein
MKIERLETHDRLLHFVQEQSNVIAEGASECLKVNPLSLALQEVSSYVYIYTHARTIGLDEKYSLFLSGQYQRLEDIPEKRLLWQPRLGRPTPSPNSYLFRAESKTDILEICWILPPEEMWDQYTEGKVTASEWDLWSINEYKTNKEGMARPLSDDLRDEQINLILRNIAREMQQKNKPSINEV